MSKEFLFISLLFFGIIASVNCTHWALLVAGSNTWDNYRHQADVCHAYHVFHNFGIPDENIVVMMYDDIANNPQNPFPGNIINYPGGPNVYKGVLKDYTGTDVNPQNFLNILSGNSSAMEGIGSGKVIASGPEDKIFVFFSDHGATNLIAFPDDYLYADKLMSTLNEMYEAKKYKEMVIYIEACESGSMFSGLLPDNVNIYTTTASNPCESSFACYYDDKRDNYLGDCYSVNFLLNTENSNIHKETFEQQFKQIAQETNESEVCQYGQQSIASEHISQFFTTQKNFGSPMLPIETDRVDQRDATLAKLARKLKTVSPHEKKYFQQQIDEILSQRKKTDLLFNKLKTNFLYEEETNSDNNCNSCQGFEVTRDFECFRKGMETIQYVCGQFDHYALKYANVIARMCNRGVEPLDMMRTANEFCANY